MHPAPYEDRADDPCGPSVTAVNDVESGLVHLRVRGAWDPELHARTNRWLGKSFAERPAAVIVDLGGLVDPEATSLPTWLHARRVGACLEPPIEVAVCLPAGHLAGRLNRMGAGRFLPTFTTVSEARTAMLSRRVLTDRVVRRLPPERGSLATARRMITGCCTGWDLPDLSDDAALIVSELVANAVEHAGTEVLLLVSRRRDGVHIAVCDEDPALPRVPEHDEVLHLRGRGLILIEAITHCWGAMPTATGKVVWATLHRR